MSLLLLESLLLLLLTFAIGLFIGRLHLETQLITVVACVPGACAAAP